MTHELLIHPAVAVRNGAELLDRVRPGWRDAIDWETLDLRSCVRCVVGQLTGIRDESSDVFARAYASLSGSDHPPELFGFDTDPETSYTELTDAWLDWADENGLLP